MASKKTGKKTTKKTSSTTPQDAATKALLAVSSNKSATDNKHNAILNCLISVFTDVGVPNVDSTTKIIWEKFVDPPDIIDQIGNGVRDCINEKGFQCDGLAGAFQKLKDLKKTTVVDDLATGIEKVVKP